jgi:hypothetical protein
MQLAAVDYHERESLPRAGENFEETMKEIDKAGTCSHGSVSDTHPHVRFASIPWKYEFGIVRVPKPLAKQNLILDSVRRCD